MFIHNLKYSLKIIFKNTYDYPFCEFKYELEDMIYTLKESNSFVFYIQDNISGYIYSSRVEFFDDMIEDGYIIIAKISNIINTEDMKN